VFDFMYRQRRFSVKQHPKAIRRDLLHGENELDSRSEASSKQSVEGLTVGALALPISCLLFFLFFLLLCRLYRQLGVYFYGIEVIEVLL